MVDVGTATRILHEAFLRLVDQTSAIREDRVHFLTYASTTMRTVLLDHARRQSRVERGADAVRRDWLEAKVWLQGVLG